MHPSEFENTLKDIGAAYNTDVDNVVSTVKEKFGKEMTKSQEKDFERNLREFGNKKFNKAAGEFKIESKKTEQARNEALENCTSEKEEKKITETYNEAIKKATTKLAKKVADIQDVVTKATEETVKAVQTSRIENKKKVIEDKVRDYLRGFARRIPSFLMAYGDN